MPRCRDRNFGNCFPPGLDDTSNEHPGDPGLDDTSNEHPGFDADGLLIITSSVVALFTGLVAAASLDEAAA